MFRNAGLARLQGLFSTLKGIVSLLRNPGNTLGIYDIEDGFRYRKSTEISVEFIKSQPEVNRLIQERYLAPEPDLETLAKCPFGSLGYCYAAYFKDLGLTPDFFRTLTVDDDTSYIFLRRRQTHDLWHVITGFATNLPSELGLKAFEMAQLRNPMSGIIVAGGIFRTVLKTPQDLSYTFKQIASGFFMGLQAKPLLAQKWEENWDKPLAQWREELGIKIESNSDSRSSINKELARAS